MKPMLCKFLVNPSTSADVEKQPVFDDEASGSNEAFATYQPGSNLKAPRGIKKVTAHTKTYVGKLRQSQFMTADEFVHHQQVNDEINGEVVSCVYSKFWALEASHKFLYVRERIAQAVYMYIVQIGSVAHTNTVNHIKP